MVCWRAKNSATTPRPASRTRLSSASTRNAWRTTTRWTTRPSSMWFWRSSTKTTHPPFATYSASSTLNTRAPSTDRPSITSSKTSRKRWWRIKSTRRVSRTSWRKFSTWYPGIPFYPRKNLHTRQSFCVETAPRVETVARHMGQNAHRTENRTQHLSPPARHGNAPVSTQEPFQSRNRFNPGTLSCSIQFFKRNYSKFRNDFWAEHHSHACKVNGFPWWPSFITALENERNFPRWPFFKFRKGQNFITGFVTGKCHVKIVILDCSHAATLHAVEEPQGKRPMTARCLTQCSNGCSLGSFLFLRQDNPVQRCTGFLNRRCHFIIVI